MASRVLGFIRTVLIANILGTGQIADAFFVAFRFANFFRGLLSEGAFNSAFVPLFSRKLSAGGRTAAVNFAGEVVVVAGSVCLLFTITAEFGMPWLVFVFAPGFSNDADKFALTVELTRIIFPYFLFTVLVALIGGMLNSVGRFAAAAAAPVLLNVMLISVLIALNLGLPAPPGHALAWGVTIAGFMQFLWIIYACKRAGIMFSLPRPRLTPDVRRLVILVAPALAGAGAVQINLMIDVILASTLQEGSISYLYYADRVYQLPLAVIGIAVGVALLPLLTRQLQTGEFAAAQDSQNRAIEFVLTFTLPATMAVLVIADPIIIVLFQRGAFDSSDVYATSGALSAYAAGLPAYVLIKALTPGFFAREDTGTPVKIAIVTVIINIILAIILMQYLAHVGIALATALAAWINAASLAVILVHRGHLEFDLRLRRCVPRLLLSTSVMAVILWWINSQLSEYFAGGEAKRIAALALIILGGGISYMLMAIGTGAIKLADIKYRLRA